MVTYIWRAPRDPPNTTMVLPMTEEEWPAMGGGPWVVTMQFHLGGQGSQVAERLGNWASNPKVAGSITGSAK